MINFRWCRKHDACYEDSALKKLFPVPRGLDEVLTLEIGPWKDVGLPDRIWVWQKYYNWDDVTLRKFTQDFLNWSHPRLDIEAYHKMDVHQRWSYYSRVISPLNKPVILAAFQGFYTMCCYVTQEQRAWIVSYLLEYHNASVSQAKSDVDVVPELH